MSYSIRQYVSREELIRIIKFAFTGLLNAGFGFCIYTLTYLMSNNTFIALLVANILGILFNFFTTGRIVFNNSDPARLTSFTAIYLVVFVVNYGLLQGLLMLNFNPISSQAILIVPIAGLTYVLQRLFVFKLHNGKTL